MQEFACIFVAISLKNKDFQNHIVNFFEVPKEAIKMIHAELTNN